MSVLRVAFLSSAVLEFFASLSIALVAVYLGMSHLGYFSFGTYGRPLTLADGLFILLLAPSITCRCASWVPTITPGPRPWRRPNK